MNKFWFKKYHVSLSGELLLRASEEKRQMRLSWSAYLRSAVASFASDTKTISRRDFKEVPGDPPSTRLQLGLDESLCTWMDRQVEYLYTNPTFVVQHVLRNRLGVPIETETNTLESAAVG